MVSQELLNELQVILKEEYSIELSREDLARFANTIVSFFSILAKIETDAADGTTT